MARPLAGLVSGALAGMAGTTALNAVSSLDGAVRARPASSTPEQTVNALADKADVPIPGDPDEVANRLEGLGPLAGYGVGIGVGALGGLLRGMHAKVPFPLAVLAVGLGAMALSDTVMTALKITDPRTWTAGSVAADALPHLAYGAVTVASLHRMIDPSAPRAR